MADQGGDGLQHVADQRETCLQHNLASEFYVMSVLCRLGMGANLTLGKKKAVDFVVFRAAGDAVTVDVKAVVGKADWLR